MVSNNSFSNGGRLFSFGHLPPTEAILVEVAIARVCGDALFKAFASTKKSAGQTEEEAKASALAAGSAAIGLMLTRMDGDELVATMERVFKYVSVDGNRCIIEQDFLGRNKELWLVFIAAIKFNFSDFLTEGLLASVQKFTLK